MGSVRTLPNYLRMHRKRTGLSQREVALLLGRRNSSKVSRYERGVRKPMLPDILALEFIYETPARRLFKKTFHTVAPQVRDRARGLLRHLESEPNTQLVKYKKKSLVAIVNQEWGGRAA